MKLLVIPDYHAHAEYDNNRATLLGRYIVEEQPDTLVCLGDFADMASLSSYDRGTKGFEGRRYKKDVAATQDALECLHAPIRAYNREQAKGHRTRYKPDLVMCLGNHEGRITRAANSAPEFDGTISVDDLGFEGYGWRVHDFLEPVLIAGISFCHYFPSRTGRALGGERVASSLLGKKLQSVVVGHGHNIDYAERARPDGSRAFALSAGCMAHPAYEEPWCKGAREDWWTGVVMLEGAAEGYYKRLSFVTLKQLEEMYG